MSLSPSPQEYEQILRLPAKKRFEYLVKRVADAEEVWGLLGEDGWVTAEDGARKYLALWPSRAFAAACATGNWEGAEPRAMDLETLGAVFDEAEAKGWGVYAFPRPEGGGVAVEVSFFVAALEEELEAYG